MDKIRLVIVYLSREVDKSSAHNDDDESLGIIPLLNVCLAKAVNKDRQNKVTEKYHVELDPEDRDKTAGEQIIYKHYREMWKLGEQNKELGEQNKELGEQIRELRANAQNTAKILKDSQVPVDVIAKSTGLSIEQIEAL